MLFTSAHNVTTHIIPISQFRKLLYKLRQLQTPYFDRNRLYYNINQPIAKNDSFTSHGKHMKNLLLICILTIISITTRKLLWKCVSRLLRQRLAKFLGQNWSVIYTNLTYVQFALTRALIYTIYSIIFTAHTTKLNSFLSNAQYHNNVFNILH